MYRESRAYIDMAKYKKAKIRQLQNTVSKAKKKFEKIGL
jgi:hypothetical protein